MAKGERHKKTGIFRILDRNFLHKDMRVAYVTIYNYENSSSYASNGFISLYINDTSVNPKGKDFVISHF